MQDNSDKTGAVSTEWLRGIIESAVTGWENDHPADRFWRMPPLVACASAADPLFGALRGAVSQEHAMPVDLLPEARTVIVFFLPFKRELGRENDRTPVYASRNWALAYTATNSLIEAVNLSLTNRIEKAGHRAAVTPATHNFDSVKLISQWSHKHLAYIAGLGTFGLHRMIITRAGCCGRLGSLVTTMPFPPSERPRVEFCLRKAGRECRACADRCTYEALSTESYDRHACYRQCLVNDGHYSDLPLVDVCGKCSCEVPCSHGVPGKP